jgi:putative NIF3 family GTP cyclohydrolase 1 type 2
MYQMHKQPIDITQGHIGRRQFVTTLLTAAGTSSLLMISGIGMAQRFASDAAPLTIQQVIDLILKNIPSASFSQTVDTIKAGDPAQVVKGIITTMFATAEVIEKAAGLGANFIIAHEPTFYSHTDDTEWLQGDEVYQYKTALLKKHNMVVWRFHDYLHAYRPDGVLTGVLTALGWGKYYNADNPMMVTIPSATLQEIIALTKTRLGIAHVKMIGDGKQPCSRILLIPGAAGGRMQMNALRKEKPDLLIVGELNEWETSEYVRDLRQGGAKTCLLVLGHILSEEPGLEWLVKWLQPQMPSVKMHHIPSGDAFSWA